MESIWTELWGAAKQAGPFATTLLLGIAYLLWRDFGEERKKNDAMLERTLNGLNDATNTLKSLVSMLERGREHYRERGRERDHP